jgi:hypothetical protein
MDNSGNIYELAQGQQPKVGHFKLTEAEARALADVAKERRRETLQRLRAEAAERKGPVARRPRSCLPKSLRPR